MRTVMKKIAIIALLFVFLPLAACGGFAAVVQDDEGPSDEPAPSEISDLDSLIAALEVLGAQVLRGGDIEQPFFTVEAQVLTIYGGDVQVFEYADAQARQAEAEQIGSDGSSVGTTMITWIGKPHFFQAGRLLIIYVGDDAAILEALEAILGAQFAGR